MMDETEGNQTGIRPSHMYKELVTKITKEQGKDQEEKIPSSGEDWEILSGGCCFELDLRERPNFER